MQQSSSSPGLTDNERDALAEKAGVSKERQGLGHWTVMMGSSMNSSLNGRWIMGGGGLILRTQSCGASNLIGESPTGGRPER